MDPISPQDDPALIAKLAAMTDAEFTAVVNRARGSTSDAVRAAETRGDWRTSFALKSRQLSDLMNPKTEKKG